LQNPDIDGGLRLTLATLATFTKYPKESFTAAGSKKLTKNTAYKKFGFFQAEKNIFKEIAKAVGLKSIEDGNYWWCRHPLSVLVEAADDICYGIMDLEDGFRLGLISFKETEELLMPLIPPNELDGYKGRDEKEKIGYLRAKAISELVSELADKFIDEEKRLLDGKFEGELISVIEKADVLRKINDISVEKIYRYKSVVEREVAGYEVLGGLLDTFIHAYNEAYEGNLSRKNWAVVNLMPKRITNNPPDDIYLRLLSVIDFVSGMTDSFAVSLFRKIKGISLPGGRFTE
jgi:dGTPase